MTTTLDHVGLIVPRLDEAARIFRALGFTLTERAEHTRVNAAGEVESAGSAQHSVMFEDGYIELQEITDPEQRHLLSPARGPAWSASPFVTGLSLRMEDPGPLADRARAEGFAVHLEGESLFVDLSRTCGVTLILDPA